MRLRIEGEKSVYVVTDEHFDQSIVYIQPLFLAVALAVVMDNLPPQIGNDPARKLRCIRTVKRVIQLLREPKFSLVDAKHCTEAAIEYLDQCNSGKANEYIDSFFAVTPRPQLDLCT